MNENLNYFADKFIVFYDGDCGFCNHWVQWILKNDKKDKFLFASLQSEFGQKFLSDRNIETKTFDTIFVWKPQSFYLTKYQAILKISSELNKPFILSLLGKLIPDFLGNKIYDWIAKRRKNLKKDFCLILNDIQKKKFIES